jgi:hypothetical protein
VLLTALTQADQEVGDRRLVDGIEALDLPAGQELEIAVQVAPVGAQGVVGQAALDAEMVQVGPQRTLDVVQDASRRASATGTVAMS